MDAFQYFPHAESSQQTSTPKFDRLTSQKQHQLFNANESAILDVEASVQEVQIAVSKDAKGLGNSCKRRLFDTKPVPRTPRTAVRIIPNKRVKVVDVRNSSGASLKTVRETPKLLVDHQRKWSAAQRSEFFSAVHEHGVDCDAIAERMCATLQAKYADRVRTKSADSIREFCQEIFLIVGRIVDRSADVTDRAFQTYALINFGIWNRYFGEEGCRKLQKNAVEDAHVFRNLFNSGKSEVKNSTVNEVVTPKCFALQRLHLHEEIQKVPHTIRLHLRPRSGFSWSNVKRSRRCPLTQLHMNRSHTLADLRDFVLQHWHIERKEHRYYNFDEHRLILYRSNGTPLHFPDLMPDFDTCFGIRPYSWSAYKGYEEKTAAQRRESRKCSDQERLFNDDDARFDGDNDSDDADNGIVVKDAKKKPESREIFREFFDKEQLKLVSTNKQHLQTTFAELYLIIGQNGQIHMDYEWIIPDEEVVHDLPAELLLHNSLSDLFYDRMQIKKPEPPRQPLQPVLVDIPANIVNISPVGVSQIDCTGNKNTNVCAAVPENPQQSGFVFSSTDTLSEYLVPNNSVQSSVSADIQCVSSVPSQSLSQSALPSAVPLQIISSPMSQVTFQLQSTPQGGIMMVPLNNATGSFPFLSNVGMGFSTNLIQLNSASSPQLLLQQVQTPFGQQYVIGNQFVQGMGSTVIAPAPASSADSRRGRPPKPCLPLPRQSNSVSKLLKRPTR
ncbi:uncharacterized protein LOC129581252 [Paramacrobiotus metropolitanus]|uniref:uncharacterized protein LOC129581252 n=1 Tax=Paramacrobiotus metropolitanus TaxID=2943436 RepID=UPI00244630F2|nr:uncharacterized protein LOC129581252 [Paramacrobiotus metropolitanus]